MKTIASLIALLTALPAVAQDNPFEQFTRQWRDDPVWYDGRAEIALYDATRTIYGKPRHYVARFMINKEHASPETFTKAAAGAGREVFKLHVREDIPTEKYTYHYSTMCYVGVDDLKSLKLDMGSQEDCGATFKQYLNHAGKLWWRQFSYFPDEGHADGEYEPPAALVFQDALPLNLRGFPFNRFKPIAAEDWSEDIEFDLIKPHIILRVIPDQSSTRLSKHEPLTAHVHYRGLETVKLPTGETQAHHVTVTLYTPVPESAASPKIQTIKTETIEIKSLEPRELRMHDYWFAADPALRHVMVQYEGPVGQTYKLRSVERDAYWRR